MTKHDPYTDVADLAATFALAARDRGRDDIALEFDVFIHAVERLPRCIHNEREQRRYEIAKATLPGLVTSPYFTPGNGEDSGRAAEAAVVLADALLAVLERGAADRIESGAVDEGD